MKKNLIIIGSVVLVVGLFFVLGWIFFKSPSTPAVVTPTDTSLPTSTPTSTTTTVGVTGLVITAPALNAAVSSPFKVTGYITGEDRWTAFEGQAGVVRLLDANGVELAVSPLTAVGNWMQSHVDFETNLTFAGPTTATGTLVFRNENASGEPAFDRQFSMPVSF